MPVHLSVVGKTDIGRVRKNNEDAFVVADLSLDEAADVSKLVRFELGARGALLAVSDGLGGHRAGEVASAMVIESIRRSLAKRPPSEPGAAIMEQATARANLDVWAQSQREGVEPMGATLTAVLIRGKIAYIAEVGDSRAYLIRGGRIRQVTHDQSYVQVLVDSGAMTPAEAEESSLRNVVLQAMGLEKTVKVALGCLELRHRDAFVLCSDGLTTKVTDDEIRATVLSAATLGEACSKLVDLANQRGGDDNVTVVVAGVGGALPRAADGESISATYTVLQDLDGAPARH
jgi:serine/threonine protein phosphatase PrpC